MSSQRPDLKPVRRRTLGERVAIVAAVICALLPVALVILGVWNTRDATKKTEPITRLGGYVHYGGDDNSIVLGLSGAHSVHLDDCPVTDDDLGVMRSTLESMPNLHQLLLFKTQITDNGLKHLSGLTQVRSIDLRQTQVTPEGVARL
ncbi:MAG: hypothetical protein IAG10_00055, partial [Planctomycetaceae bacterium]|nr:hypothetical protein [Planctomycetaceae bacterium]